MAALGTSESRALGIAESWPATLGSITIERAPTTDRQQPIERK
jgi:hypothetical protein